MELKELSQRLPAFCKAMYSDDSVRVSEVIKMPGHAGFAFGFSVSSSDGNTDKWFLRLPPPNVKRVGTADVLRQVAALNAMPASVPHCTVKWSGEDEQWFGRPYFVVPQLDGDVVKITEDNWIAGLEKPARDSMAKQAINALAAIHRVDWRTVSYLGEPVAFVDDVLRWDRFLEKVADPERLALAPQVKSMLLEQLPSEAPIGVFHGDFQWANLFYSHSGSLLAVIDWELTGVGATLNDVGWFATFNDPEAWASNRSIPALMPHADQLITMYEEAWGEALPSLNWYRALAAYKFAIISGFNLMLHRRGKRHDPMWEISKESIIPLLARAQALLKYP